MNKHARIPARLSRARTLAGVLALAAACSTVAPATQAQDRFPTKTMRLVTQ